MTKGGISSASLRFSRDGPRDIETPARRLTTSAVQHTYHVVRHRRVAKLVAAAVERIELDLTGLHVLTEGATGPYVVTPVIAALAGAEVLAFTKDSRHGSVEQVRRETTALAAEMNVRDSVQVVQTLSDDQVFAADIVTNSGHLRPLDRAFVGRMKPGAVIPLMYETWEFRATDVDLDACRERGIKVAGTNEQHPKVGVFDYLGMAVLYGLVQCRVPAPFSRILLICDNAFAPYIARTLIDCGAELEILTTVDLPSPLGDYRRAARTEREYDAVVVADPSPRPVIGSGDDAKYRPEEIGRFHALVQIFGDVDRDCLGNVLCYPTSPPPKGHMGVNLSELGPDPVVRLQAAGLKVGEALSRFSGGAAGLMDYCQLLVAP